MRIILCLTLLFLSSNTFAQEEQKDPVKSSFNAVIGVVDMKRILAQSKAYQSLVDQFENVRRKQRNQNLHQIQIPLLRRLWMKSQETKTGNLCSTIGRTLNRISRQRK